MALITCPECNRERVSSEAESCPECGFGIKAHFDAIKKKEESSKLISELKMRGAERLEERINSVELPSKPRYPIWTIICTVVSIMIGIPSLSATEWDVAYSRSHGNGDPRIAFPVMLIWAIAFFLFGIYRYTKKRSDYQFSKENPSAYRKNKIADQDIKQAADMQRVNNVLQNQIKCPNCGKTNVSKMSVVGKAVSIGAVGLASNKIGKSYNCDSCGYMW